MKKTFFCLLSLSLLFLLQAFYVQDAVLLRLNLQKGSTYDYTTVFTTDVSMAGQPVSKMKMGSKMNLEVIDKYGRDSTLIRAKFQHLTMNISAMGNERTFDSKNASGANGNPFYKVFAAMRSNPVILKTNALGEILEIRGMDRLRQAVKDSMGQSNPSIQKMMSSFISEDAFRRNFTNIGIFPEKPVSVGDHWDHRKKTISGKNIMEIDIHTTYTVKSIEPDKVVLLVDGQIIGIKDSATINGMTVPAHISGTQTGTYSIDPSTGLISEGHISQVMNMKISMMGREMQMEMKGNSIITEKPKP